MPLSLPLQTLDATGIQRIEIPTLKKLVVLSISNLGDANMWYYHKEGEYGDTIFAGGWKAYLDVDKDVIPPLFFIRGTATQTFTVHYEEEQ